MTFDSELAHGFSHTISVMCEVTDCGEILEAFGEKSVKGATEYAKAQGWTKVRGHNVCPNHKNS